MEEKQLNSHTEGKMLHKLIRKDQDEWSRFYATYRPLLKSCVSRVLYRSRFSYTQADLEDIIGEVWLALLRYDLRRLRLYDKEKGRCLTSWLSMLATHCTIDYLRTRSAQKRSPELGDLHDLFHQETPSPDEQVELQQWAELTCLALAQLRKEERLFLKRCFEESEVASLAQEMGISISTVHTRKFRLRSKLSHLVDAWEKAPRRLKHAYAN